MHHVFFSIIILYLHHIKYGEIITYLNIFLWSPWDGNHGMGPSLQMTLLQEIPESILHTLMMSPAIARSMAFQSPLQSCMSS